MTTPKAGTIPIRQGKAVAQKREAKPVKTTFEEVLSKAAKATRAPAEAAEEARVEEAKEAFGLAAVRMLLKNQKPGDIERDKPVDPDDD